MSLQQKLREFSQLKLNGIIPWEAFKFPDTVNSDVTRCVIEGRNGTYRIEVTSSYSAPPLGRVVFTDGDYAIEDVNQDAAWHAIAEHLKGKEAGASYTISDLDPRNAAILAQEPVVVPITHNPLAIPDRSFVYYWAEANAWYHNGPAVVTRVNRDGSYNLTVFPEGSEPVYRERVARKSDRLQHVCWEDYPSKSAAAPSIDVEDVRQRAATEIAALVERVEELAAKVEELSQKRGPGRPSTKVA